MKHLPPAVHLFVLAAALSLLSVRTGLTWGDDTHEAVARGAAVMVAEPMRPFFLANTPYLAFHATDPDYIPDRTQEQKAEHFLDLDLFGKPPFKELPRDRKAAEAKFGADVMVERGLLPWAVQREYDRLTAALKRKDWTEARMAAAHLSHFVADATMPLHATANYNGQLTENAGIHLRVETELIPRYHPIERIPAGSVVEIRAPVKWAFKTLQDSLSCCDTILKADTAARKIAALDTEQYYAALDRGCGALLDERMRLAATAVASFWTAAWRQAGSPAMPVETAVVIIQPSRSALREMSAERAASLTPAAGALNGTLKPFDALAYCESDAPGFMRSFTLQFMTVRDEMELANPMLGHVFGGKLADSLGMAARALEQFPESRRVVVLISAGWKTDPAALEQARAMKSKDIKCLFLVKGEKEDSPQAEELAEASGGRLVRLANGTTIEKAVKDAMTSLIR